RHRHAGMIGLDHAGAPFADAVDDEGIEIEQCRRRVDHPPLRQAFAGDDQRHAAGLLVERRLTPPSALADGVAVVAWVDDARFLGEAAGRKRIEHLAGLLVHEAAQAVIAGDRAADVVFALEVVVEIERARVVAHERMVGPLVAVVEFRLRQARVVVVVVEMLGRCRQRIMRGDERDEQHPRLVAIFRRLLVQPDLRAGGDLAIVLRVGRLAGAGHARHLVGGAAHRQVIADEPEQIAFALDHVHRHDRFGEAAVVLVGAEVELADRDHAMPGVAQAVMPARDRAVVGVGVVPEADLVDVVAGGEGGARRDADRGGGPAGGETGAGLRQPVEVGRAHERVAVAAHAAAAVLIRHDDQQVLRSHARAPPRQGASALANAGWILYSYYSIVSRSGKFVEERREERRSAKAPEHSPPGLYDVAGPTAAGGQSGRPAMLRGLAVAIGLLLGLSSALAQSALAQDWPQRPVRLVVPYAAGGGTDAVARVLALKLGDAFGQRFVVENKP